MEEEDVRGDRGLSVFRLRAVSRLTLVVRCTEIGYSVSTQVLGFRFGCGWCCVVGFLFGCCWFCVLLLCVSAWWNRGIADEVTMASYGRAVTGAAVMARSANEEKKKIELLSKLLSLELFSKLLSKYRTLMAGKALVIDLGGAWSAKKSLRLRKRS